jgi:hypothetical protein
MRAIGLAYGDSLIFLLIGAQVAQQDFAESIPKSGSEFQQQCSRSADRGVPESVHQEQGEQGDLFHRRTCARADTHHISSRAKIFETYWNKWRFRTVYLSSAG